jgi:hypothetical protein
MTSNNQSTGTGSSAFSKLDEQSTNLNTPAIQVGNAVRDGDEFVLIVQSRQSDAPKIWASGDKSQMQQLVRTTYNQLTNERLTTG